MQKACILVALATTMLFSSSGFAKPKSQYLGYQAHQVSHETERLRGILISTNGRVEEANRLIADVQGRINRYKGLINGSITYYAPIALTDSPNHEVIRIQTDLLNGILAERHLIYNALLAEYEAWQQAELQRK